MPNYRFQAVGTNGRLVRGVRRASSEDALRSSLRAQGVTAVSWQVVPGTSAPARRLASKSLRLRGREVALLTRQLAVMTRAGLPLVRCLVALEEQRAGSPAANVLSGIRTRVESGESLASALSVYPRIFGRFYVSLIAAGEATGDMDRALERLADHLERRAELRKKLQGALVYPILVATVAGAVVGGLLLFVVPTFAELFRSFGQALPAPTRLVVALSGLLGRGLLPALLLLVSIGAGGRGLWRRPTWRRRLERGLLRTPGVGGMLRRLEVANQARVFSAVLRAGVPMLEALQLAIGAAASLTYRDELGRVEGDVRRGEPLARSLARTGGYAADVCQLVAMGETTGSLDAAWQRVAELYETEVDQGLATLTTLIEPIFLGVLGVGVGAVLIALYLPIFQIGTLVR